MEATSSAQQAEESPDTTSLHPDLEREILDRHSTPVDLVPWEKVKEKLGL